MPTAESTSASAVKAFLALDAEAARLLSTLANYAAIKNNAAACLDASPFPSLHTRLVGKLISHAEEASAQLRLVAADMKNVAKRAQDDADKSMELALLKAAFAINQETARKLQLLETLPSLGEVDDDAFFASLAQAWPSDKALFSR